MVYGFKSNQNHGIFHTPVKASAQLDFTPDMVLLTEKTQDVEATCKQVKDYVEGVPFLTLQNRVRSDELASSILGKENIIGGIIMFNANFQESGVVTSGMKGDLIIGESYRENGERTSPIRYTEHGP